MEVLSNVLSAMKLSGSVFLEAEFSRPWCIATRLEPEDCAEYFPEPAHVISYHYVMAGTCYCARESAPPVEARAGQIVMVPRNEKHFMGDRLTNQPALAKELMQPGEDGA